MSLSRKTCFIKECASMGVSWVCLTRPARLALVVMTFSNTLELGAPRKRGSFPVSDAGTELPVGPRKYEQRAGGFEVAPSLGPEQAGSLTT